VEHLLDNPVYHALITNDAAFACGTGEVKFFDEAVSPFAGFSEEYKSGFDDLHDLLPTGRNILCATRKGVQEQKGWQQLVKIKGLQFIFPGKTCNERLKIKPVLLQQKDVEQMIALTALTKPGPFGKRTIEFGHYYGIFEDEQLVAMTGQRLHISGFTEVSAVCTHPDHLGKGFAAALLQHQLAIILNQGQTPFLHVREDNSRAIALYERLGFTVNGAMNFYFLKRM
jgi:GNAT superfamily N-acetyltransferase